MNTIGPIYHRSKHWHAHELVIAIDEIPLDQILSRFSPELDGLFPAFYDDLMSEDERRIVWERIIPAPGEQTRAPVLICPDDGDLSCCVVIAEIVGERDTIRWLRLGTDATEDRRSHLGDTVSWISDVGPFAFCRNDYEDFVRELRSLTTFDNDVST